jgi:hypothetical protein
MMEKVMKKRWIGGFVAAAILAATTATAHHSGAMFDSSKLVKFQGTADMGMG